MERRWSIEEPAPRWLVEWAEMRVDQVKRMHPDDPRRDERLDGFAAWLYERDVLGVQEPAA
jgi:hypothetical protein